MALTASTTTAVAEPLRRELAAVTGVDPATVTIHRDPQTTETAAGIAAKAFTDHGEVFLPAAHGPLDREPARSLLAHELAHVAQQRRLGPSLPREDTAPGQLLEEEAAATEQAVARTVPAAATRPQPAPRAVPPQPARTPQRAAEPADGGGEAAAPPAAPTPAAAAGGADQGAPSGADAEDDAAFQAQVRRMAGPLMHEIRRQLLLERERAGFLLDGR